MGGNNSFWNVIYTRSRAEKKVNKLLNEQGIITFLPLVKEIRQWSDRRKKVEVPLINSYIFVKADKSNYLKILETPGVVKFVKFINENAKISEQEINNLRIITSNNIKDFRTIRKNFNDGDKVKIKLGNFKGLTGVIDSQKKDTLIVNIIELKMSFLIEISKFDVIKI